jgi:hypothetical protein
MGLDGRHRERDSHAPDLWLGFIEALGHLHHDNRHVIARSAIIGLQRGGKQAVSQPLSRADRLAAEALGDLARVDATPSTFSSVQHAIGKCDRHLPGG